MMQHGLPFLADEADRLSGDGEGELKVMDIPDVAGDAPLHVAISWGHVELAQLMIERGASTTSKNNKKMTPLDLASPGAAVALMIPDVVSPREIHLDPPQIHLNPL